MAKRILIVDDSVTIQKAFTMTFGGEDVTLMAARSADEGLTMAQRARPDLVVADAVMPGRSGYDLCASVKSDPGLRGVPVYILTSSHNPYDELQGRQVAADGYLVKPFETGAIIASVGEAIAKGVIAALPGPPPGAPARGASSLAAGDDYGEISVGSGSGVRPGAALAPRLADGDLRTPPLAPPPARPAPSTATAAPALGMRPSLIPGLRPGIPSARPGGMPVRSPGLPGAAPAASTGSAPAASAPSAFPPSAFPRGPVPQAPPVGMRTMMGLPAQHLQVPPRAPAPMTPAPPLRPVAAPTERTPPPAALSPGVAAHLADAAAARVAERMASISARGPEYEAIARLSREIIEKIAREIIPGLAEAIVREELQKRGRI